MIIKLKPYDQENKQPQPMCLKSDHNHQKVRELLLVILEKKIFFFQQKIN